MVSQHTALVVGERYLGRIARLPAEGPIPKIRSQGGITVIFLKILKAVQERVGKTGCSGTQVTKWGASQAGTEPGLLLSTAQNRKHQGTEPSHGPLRTVANEEWGHQGAK